MRQIEVDLRMRQNEVDLRVRQIEACFEHEAELVRFENETNGFEDETGFVNEVELSALLDKNSWEQIFVGQNFIRQAKISSILPDEFLSEKGMLLHPSANITK